MAGHPLQARHLPGAALHDQSYQTGCRLTIDPELLALVLVEEMTPAEVCALPRVEQFVNSVFFMLLISSYEPLLAARGGATLSAPRTRGLPRRQARGMVRVYVHVARRAAESVPFSRLSINPP